MIELNLELVVVDLETKTRLDVFLASETGWTRSQIKQQIDNSYQEITDFKEEMISDKKQQILQLTIKGTMKKELKLVN